MQGAVDPGYTGAPEGAAYDPASNQILFGDIAGSNVSFLNGSTAAIRTLLYLPLLPGHWTTVGSYPVAFAYGARYNMEYVSEEGNKRIAYVNATTDRVERIVWSPGDGSLAVDPSTGDLFVSNWSNISVLDGRSGNSVANIPVAAFDYELAYDPLTHQMWAVQDNGGPTLLILNDSSFQVASRVTLAEGAISQLVFDPRDSSMIAVGQLGGAFVTGGYAMLINASSGSSSSSAGFLNLSSWLTSEAYDPDNDIVYATDGGMIYAIDARNDTLVRSFGIATDALAYSPRDHLLFAIGGYTNYSIALINGLNDTIAGFVPYEVTYLEATLDSDTGLIYATTPEACNSPGAVSLFDPTTSPHFLSTLPTGDGPSGIAFDPTDHRIFVTNYCSNSLSVYNSSSNELVRLNVTVGSEPFGVVFDPRLDTLFVAEAGSDAVTELNASSYAVVANYSLPAGDCPYEIGLAGPEQQVYVTDSCGSNISVLDALNHTVAVANLTTGFSSQGVLYDPDNGVVYVANTDANTITRIAASNRTVLGQIRVSNGPTSLAYDPTDDLLFAADTVGSRISVIDTLSNVSTGPTLPASLNPSGIVYVPDSRQVDVFAGGTGAVNILANTPTIESVVLSPSPTEVGTPTTIGVVAVNGSGGYMYTYDGLPSGCAPQDAPVLICPPTTAGTFNLTVTVTDSVGYAWWSETNLTVGGSVGLAAFSANPAVLDLGDTLQLSAEAVGGVAPLSYSYSGLPPGCYSTPAPNLGCVPTEFGTYQVTATVTDVLGREASRLVLVTVNPRLQLLQFGSTPNPVAVGAPTSLEVVATGGTSPLSYSYDGLPAGCVSMNSSRLTCTPDTAGNSTVTALVTDSLGQQATTTFVLTVVGTLGPSPLVPGISYAVTPTCSNGVPGGSVALIGSASGGKAPYTFSWRLPTGTINGSSVNTSLAAGGSSTVSLTVADASGAHVTVSEEISVAAISCSSSTGPGAPSFTVELAWLVAGVAAGTLLGGLLLWGYLRRSRARPPTAEARPDNQ